VTVQIAACDPASSAARAMGEALWEEIQRRYGFTAPYPFDPADYAGPVGGFWIALLDDRPVGSVALAERADGDAELDVMYVAPDARGAGVAQALLAALEEHARSRGVRRLVLRARARPTGVARVEFELAGRDGGTEVIQSERPIEGPPARLHNPVQDWLIDRRNREGLRRLKQLVERR